VGPETCALYQKENYDAWIVASNAYNQPPIKQFANHPIWAENPKLSMLPGEAEFAHERAWPAKPSAAVRLMQVNYVLPDMVAKAINGMPTNQAMAGPRSRSSSPSRTSSRSKARPDPWPSGRARSRAWRYHRRTASRYLGRAA
jgi:hypothetical protein